MKRPIRLLCLVLLLQELGAIVITDDGESNGDEVCETKDIPTAKWVRSKYTHDDFTIAGVNLAEHKIEPPFELYDDFDISWLVTGNEGWNDLLEYRNKLQRPSLSFYVDKVARKRWLPTRGFHQPHIYSMGYASEIDGLYTLDQAKGLHQKLPSKASYAAKPTHMSLLSGNWLVRYDSSTEVTHYSNSGRQFQQDDGNFSSKKIAGSLVNSLYKPPDPIESWALKNVQPGYVMEELWTAHHDMNAPPEELNMFVIWGRVILGQWNTVRGQNRWCEGFIHRNGTFATKGKTSSYVSDARKVPGWMQWDELVRIAEHLGAHKDMFRVDIFVGIPSSAEIPEKNIVKERVRERSKHLEIAVSECEIFPTTIFPADALPAEMARLWIAGYKMGSYKVIPNDEVPREFKETAMLSKDFGVE